MQKKSFTTKAIVEAGLISVIIAIISVLGTYFPVIPSIQILLLPVPIILLYLRHDIKTALGAVFTSGVIVSLFINPLVGLFSCVIYGIVGLTFGYCLKNKLKTSLTFLLLTISVTLSIMLNLTVTSYLIQKTGFIGMITETVNLSRESMISTMNFYKKMGVSAEQLAMFQSLLSILNVDFILRIFPALIIILSCIVSYVTYYISRTILKKLKYEVDALTPLSKLYIPAPLVLIILLSVLLGMYMSYKKIVPLGEYVLLSSQYIMQITFAVIGASTVSYYLINKLKVRKGIVIFIMIMVTFSPLVYILIFVGLIDSVFDFRKINPNSAASIRKNR